MIQLKTSKAKNELLLNKSVLSVGAWVENGNVPNVGPTPFPSSPPL
jgi:hypothetical protein